MKTKKAIGKECLKFWVSNSGIYVDACNKLDCLCAGAGIIENILGLDPQLAERIALKTEILPWLLKRIQGKGYDSNRAYASEIISILLQESRGKM